MSLKKEEGTKVNCVARKLSLNPICHKVCAVDLFCTAVSDDAVVWLQINQVKCLFLGHDSHPAAHRLCVSQPAERSFSFGAGFGVRSHISDCVFIHLVLGTWCRGISGFALVFLVPPWWSCCWHPVEVLIHSASLLGFNLIHLKPILLLPHVTHL